MSQIHFKSNPGLNSDGRCDGLELTIAFEKASVDGACAVVIVLPNIATYYPSSTRHVSSDAPFAKEVPNFISIRKPFAPGRIGQGSVRL